jgi:excisionase family DNA binding protein
MTRRIPPSIEGSTEYHIPQAAQCRGPAGRVEFFTIGEVAKMLRVSGRTVRRWIDRGQLVAHRLGGVVRIAENDLRAFLALHRRG